MSNPKPLTIDKTVYIDSENRQDALHQLGTPVEQAFTAMEVMEQAQLGGWNVRKTPLKTTATVEVGGEEMPFDLDVPRNFASVRTNPVTKLPEILGVVGNSYVPIQNEEHADLLDAIVDEGGAHFSTAGSLMNGTKVFIAMKMPMGIQIAGQDAHELYLTGFNSHDGSSSLIFGAAPVRVRCMNMQNFFMKNAVTQFRVRHTRGAKNTIAEARRVLELTFKSGELFEAEMEKLMNSKFTGKQMEALTNQLWTPPEKDASRTIVGRHEERLTLVKNLFLKSPTLTDYKGTKYAAYNAVTEYLDHFSPVPSTAKVGADVRAVRTLTSVPVREAKEKAFALLTAS